MHTKGILFDRYFINVDNRSFEKVGGSWAGQSTPDGIPLAYDPPTLKFFFQQMQKHHAPVFLDIGASTGSFSMLAYLHTRASGWAFEPNPIPYEILCANILLNGLENRVQTLPIALYSQNGEKVLHIPKGQVQTGLATLGDTVLRFNKMEDIIVKTRKLDDLHIGHVDIIKIDTEGCEKFVILGGENTIRRDMPGILFEYHSTNTRQFGYKRREIIELLKSWGYNKFEQISKEDIWATRQFPRGGN